MVRDELVGKLRSISREAVWAKLAADRIEELEEKVERIGKSVWRDVRDELPKKNGAYLCVVPTVCAIDGGVLVKAYYIGNGKWVSLDEYPQRVSHWMPLPLLPPKSELNGRTEPWL